MQKNVMRQEYRELTLEEKVTLGDLKAAGAAFWELCDELGGSRELSLAKTKIQEAVFWAVNHVTADKPPAPTNPGRVIR